MDLDTYLARDGTEWKLFKATSLLNGISQRNILRECNGTTNFPKRNVNESIISSGNGSQESSTS